MIIEDWISKNGIETLNVAGSRHSKDPIIYGLVTVILELVCTLKKPKIIQSEPCQDVLNFRPDKSEIADLPKTVDEAVERITAGMNISDVRGALRGDEPLTILAPTDAAFAAALDAARNASRTGDDR